MPKKHTIHILQNFGDPQTASLPRSSFQDEDALLVLPLKVEFSLSCEYCNKKKITKKGRNFRHDLFTKPLTKHFMKKIINPLGKVTFPKIQDNTIRTPKTFQLFPQGDV